MYDIVITGKFKRDLKAAIKRGKDINLLDYVVSTISTGQELPEKYRDHKLTGNYEGFRECHIEPDWLLVYLIEEDILTLTLTRTGTHSDLF